LLHRDDTGVPPERFGQLPAADVHRVDPAGTALQEHVGEAAGRRSDVESDLASWIDLEGIERRSELVAAATDVRIGRLDDHELGGVEQVPWLSVVSGGVSLADPHLAGENERLSTTPRLGEPAVDE
jgi:hypothetical protein